jgi:hypothetical protein
MNKLDSVSLAIIREGAAIGEKCNTYECGEACSDFQNTLADLPVTDMTYTIDSLPILCNKNNDGDCCNEEYMIEYDILNKMMESYNIEDPVEAHAKICEHYGISTDSLTVVFESDATNVALMEQTKKNKDTGLIKKYLGSLKKLKNGGIKCKKKKKKGGSFRFHFEK